MNARPFPYGIRFAQLEGRQREVLERSLLEQARRAQRLHPHLKLELGRRSISSNVAKKLGLGK